MPISGTEFAWVTPKNGRTEESSDAYASRVADYRAGKKLHSCIWVLCVRTPIPTPQPGA